jgi:transglutaminase-like putative cysteine protease
MLYKIKHTTTYKYEESVPLCHNLAILNPRDFEAQNCQSFQLDIVPNPEIRDNYSDFFGNTVYYFVIEEDHESLVVTSTSVVEVFPLAWKQKPLSLQTWEDVLGVLKDSRGDKIDIKQYTFPTQITAISKSIKAYAEQSFTSNRPIFEAVNELNTRIHTDFKYTTGFTTVSTPLSVVMEEKKGVCQDFAHLAISCLLSMGLAARYVSGYLETTAPIGKKKLVGADATHAWFSVYIPEMGWIDFDPTNNKVTDEQYITIGWGRNYFDVMPLRGIIMSGHNHKLSVAVEVARI